MAALKVVRITEELYEEAIDVLRDGFFTDENVCRAVRLLEDSPEVETGSRFKSTMASMELEVLALDAFKNGVSVAAVDSKTNQVVGVAVNKLMILAAEGEKSYFQQYWEESVKTDSCASCMEFLESADNQVDLFKLFNADCGMDIMFLGVRPTARGRQAAKLLLEQSIQVARDYDGPQKPKFVSAVFTSRFSQKSGENAGIPIIAHIPYTKYSYKGTSFADRIGLEHPTYTISAVQL